MVPEAEQDSTKADSSVLGSIFQMLITSDDTAAAGHPLEFLGLLAFLRTMAVRSLSCFLERPDQVCLHTLPRHVANLLNLLALLGWL